MRTKNLRAPSLPGAHSERDGGFSLIELLVVVLILGILATIVVFAVRGTTDDAESTACAADRRALAMAGEAYFAKNATSVIPDAGGPQGYEQSLVDAEFLRG